MVADVRACGLEPRRRGREGRSVEPEALSWKSDAELGLKEVVFNRVSQVFFFFVRVASMARVVSRVVEAGI